MLSNLLYIMYVKYHMKNRSKTEIIASILETASGHGATRTKIMYGSFLSFTQLKEYLSLLPANGLLRYQAAERIYTTTEKGRHFLQIYNQISDLIHIRQREVVKR